MVWVQTKPFILITECKQMTDLFHLFGEISGRVLSIPLDVLAWSSWEHQNLKARFPLQKAQGFGVS